MSDQKIICALLALLICPAPVVGQIILPMFVA